MLVFINHQYVGCILYPDDIILISPSIIGLQQMLVVYFATAKLFAFKFNGNESHCLSWANLLMLILAICYSTVDLLLGGILLTFLVYTC